MSMSETFKNMKFWLKEKIVFPVQDWYLDHFNWIRMEGQVFNDGDVIYVVWNGEYNKSTSIIERTKCPKLFGKLDWISDGSVIQCDYIWGMDGTVRKVRRVKVMASLKELLHMNLGLLTRPRGMRGEPSFYIMQTDDRADGRFYKIPTNGKSNIGK